MPELVKPALVVHADWSKNPAKRVMVMAIWLDGRYQIQAPQPVGNLNDWLLRLQRASLSPNGSIFFGVDFPIGLPFKFAQKAGIEHFLAWLPNTTSLPWAQFYEVAETADEIGLKRPFYPNRPGGTCQQQLIDALGMHRMADLRRRCDFAHPGRRAASPLFWTMGAQQVGKAAITGWRDFIVPKLHQLKIWPFDGQLAGLLPHRNAAVVAETYPAEVYHWLGITFASGGKGSQDARRENSVCLQMALNELGVEMTAGSHAELWAGFATDDAFDAFVGLVGMLQVVLGKRPLYEPEDAAIRQLEGWILGQQK